MHFGRDGADEPYHIRGQNECQWNGVWNRKQHEGGCGSQNRGNCCGNIDHVRLFLLRQVLIQEIEAFLWRIDKIYPDIEITVFPLIGINDLAFRSEYTIAYLY